MAVVVAAGPVVVLSAPRLGVAGKNLSVAQRDARVESVGDGGLSKRVRTDVPRYAGCFRDPGNHAVDVSPIDGVSGGAVAGSVGRWCGRRGRLSSCSACRRSGSV